MQALTSSASANYSTLTYKGEPVASMSTAFRRIKVALSQPLEETWPVLLDLPMALKFA